MYNLVHVLLGHNLAVILIFAILEVRIIQHFIKMLTVFSM